VRSFDLAPNYGLAPINSSLVVAIQDQLGLAREKERVPDRAMATPARKVFWEATPVAVVAAQVLPDQASSILRRAYAALIPPSSLKAASLSQWQRTIGTSWYMGALSSNARSIFKLSNETPGSRVFAGFFVTRDSEYLYVDYNTGGRCPSRE